MPVITGSREGRRHRLDAEGCPMPHWFKVAVLLQLAGVATLSVLLVRIGGDGARAVGDVVHWASPHLRAPSPPGVVRIAPPAASPGATTAQQLGRLEHLDGPFLNRLDQDAATTAAGELRIITALEDLIRARVEGALGAASRGR